MSSTNFARRVMKRADHVILVSIDGLRPEFARDERWPAPVLQQLSWEGAYAEQVRGVFPSHTFPAHTTIVTGARPARHGIVENRPFNADGPSKRWFWDASALRADTLWDAVRRSGGSCAAIGWPVTVGADVDWNVPDVWPVDNGATAVDCIRRAARPEGLLEQLEREATGRLRDENFSLRQLMREDRVGAMSAWLFEQHRPSLMLVHLIGTDHIQHEHGRNNPRTRRAVAAADRAVGQILEVVERLELRARTTFILVGDHGSADTHTELRPNVWLVDAGLRDAREERGDWRATFHASGGSAFLRIRAGEDETQVLDAVREALRRATTGERELFRVIERGELDALGADPDAPLALTAAAGVELGESAERPLIARAGGATHGHHPDIDEMHTGFVAAGAGIARGAVAHELPLECIAPLVAALLDVDFTAPDGVLLPGLLEGDG